MDSKQLINSSKIPEGLRYREALQSVTKFIRTTSKVESIPVNGGPYGFDNQSQATFFIEGQSTEFLHPDSVYMTGEITTTDAAGSNVETAIFNSSANDLIRRVQVRGRKSRMILADCRDYNVWSAMLDKLKYPQSAEGFGPWERGFPEPVDDIFATYTSAQGADATGAVSVGNRNYGLASRNATLAGVLDGKTQHKFEMSYCPFLNSHYMIPIAATGGLEINIDFEKFATAFNGTSTTNAASTSTATTYKIDNLKLHYMVSYLENSAAMAFNDRLRKEGIAIPYESYLSVSHVPQSENENVRLSSQLENLKAVYAVHRFSADLGSVQKASLAHFGNPQLEEIQFSSAGSVHPSVPLKYTTDDGKRVTGQALSELFDAAKDLEIDEAGFRKYKRSMEHILATSALGTAITTGNGAAATLPIKDDEKKWNGKHIVGLRMDSGHAFSSVYNRPTSQGDINKSDLICNLKYTAASVPGNKTINFFMHYSNLLIMQADGVMRPQVLTF